MISSDGVAVDPGKISAVQDWPEPTCVNEVQQFLGLCNYYQRFVRGFSKFAGPLIRLTKKDVDFVWGPSEEQAFDKLKQLLLTAPCLSIYDPALRTRVVCDASTLCLGAVLEQLAADN